MLWTIECAKDVLTREHRSDQSLGRREKRRGGRGGEWGKRKRGTLLISF